MKQSATSEVSIALKNLSKEQATILTEIEASYGAWKEKAVDVAKHVVRFVDTFSGRKTRMAYQILNMKVGLSIVVLQKLYRCGKGELVPELVIESSSKIKPALSWPVEQQKKYFVDRKPFSVWSINGSETRRSLRHTDSEFTFEIAGRVIGPNGPNSKKRQLDLLEAERKAKAEPVNYHIDGDMVEFRKNCKFTREEVATILLTLVNAGDQVETDGERSLIQKYISIRERRRASKKVRSARVSQVP